MILQNLLDNVLFLLHIKMQMVRLLEIKDAETYTIATNAFTAKGGDGYDVLKKAYEEGRVTDLRTFRLGKPTRHSYN